MPRQFAPDRAPAQFRRRRMGGVGEGRRHRARQAGGAEAGAEQVVVAAMLVRLDVAEIRRGAGAWRGAATAGQAHGAASGSSEAKEEGLMAAP
jgi:hypothetical protein